MVKRTYLCRLNFPSIKMKSNTRNDFKAENFILVPRMKKFFWSCNPLKVYLIKTIIHDNPLSCCFNLMDSAAQREAFNTSETSMTFEGLKRQIESCHEEFVLKYWCQVGCKCRFDDTKLMYFKDSKSVMNI